MKTHRPQAQHRARPTEYWKSRPESMKRRAVEACGLKGSGASQCPHFELRWRKYYVRQARRTLNVVQFSITWIVKTVSYLCQRQKTPQPPSMRFQPINTRTQYPRPHYNLRHQTVKASCDRIVYAVRFNRRQNVDGFPPHSSTALRNAFTNLGAQSGWTARPGCSNPQQS